MVGISFRRLGHLVGVALLSFACNSGSGKTTPPKATVSSAGATPGVSGTPKAATPAKGRVRGVVRVKGDPAPSIESIAPTIPVGKCFLAHDMYGKLFREGEGRTLADVLVAATEYSGEAAEPTPTVDVQAKECAYDRRTIALSLGQTLRIHNVGDTAQTPQLKGHPSAALLLAVPNGDPVEFKPDKPGQYQLIDLTNPFAFADVFVVGFSSVDVTRLDGKFEITGLPPGKAKLSALLPITGQTLSREVVIPESGSVDADFEFTFDAARDGSKAQIPRPN